MSPDRFRARLAPRAVLSRLLGLLPHAMRYEMFYQAAKSLGVRGYVAAGTAGEFAGALADQSVIRPYLRDGAWSPNIVGLFTKFFVARGGGTFIDIGANIGLITVPISRLPGLQCIAFEPDPENFGLLRANIARNTEANNVRAVNAAVAERAGQMRFTRSAYNSGDHRLAPHGDHLVSVVALDDLAPPVGPLAIKIDTQGAEPLIVAGGRRTLAAADLLVMEFWPWGMARMGLTAGPVIEFLAGHFAHGHVLLHDAAPSGDPLPIASVVARLNDVVADGGEFAQVDVVLYRQDRPDAPAGPRHADQQAPAAGGGASVRAGP